MKEFVLMNKNTGDLFAAYRVALFDKHHPNTDLGGETYGIYLSQLTHDGWIVYHPDESFAGYWIWFNEPNLDRIFEVLGEL